VKTAHHIFSIGTVLVLAGCATGQMSWDAQIGRMTYDQAVGELGQPTQQQKLSDGRMIAEWVSRFPTAAPGMDNDFRYRSASFGSAMTGAESAESKLSLTFDTNSVLADWSKD
jgi:hypothetical protein